MSEAADEEVKSPDGAPVPDKAEAAARFPLILMVSGLRAARESAAMRGLQLATHLVWAREPTPNRRTRRMLMLVAGGCGEVLRSVRRHAVMHCGGIGDRVLTLTSAH